jgi:hypothetical protein
MTLPASGAISTADVNAEIYGSASSAQVTLNDTVVRTIFQKYTAQSTIAMNDGYGKAYTIPSSSAILTGGSSFTLPRTSGPKINILAIGGGGGGGGGSGRTYWSGYTVGAGGGGSGGAAYALNVTVTPGQTITYSIGGGGGAGSPRNGRYSSGAGGGSGGTTTVYVNGSAVCQATGGGGAAVTPDNSPGTAGGISIGSTAITSTTGEYGRDSVYTEGGGAGGYGARGYRIDTGQTSIGNIITYGDYGSEGENQAGGTGTVYGGGGTGGGSTQSDRHNPVRDNAGAGGAGAVFIWWFL